VPTAAARSGLKSCRKTRSTSKALPLTERWPWLIYVVLGLVSLVLGVLIVNVARTAIALRPVHSAETTDKMTTCSTISLQADGRLRSCE
jgi:hypothetical protein